MADIVGAALLFVVLLVVVLALSGCAPYDEPSYPRTSVGDHVRDRYGDLWERCHIRGGRHAWCRVD
ncbi:MAG: hypothetical protein EHM35_03795 [Planctomycetaceae bacterium]|nr:MAG: hypothetical protein EHM35_03795 [Planctomycetaceae bacterium]